MATIITSGATLNSTQRVSSGELTLSTTVMGALGNQIIESGGSAFVTTINPNGFQQIENGGAVTSTTISANGGQIISSGGFAEVTVVNFLGGQLVDVGGSATSTTLDGGNQQIKSNAIVTNTIINDAGGQLISAGGLADNTTVNSNGVQQINSGGSAVNTIVNDDGTQQAYGGAIISSTISNARQLVFSGGTAQDTTIYSGIQEISNGFVTNTIISGGNSSLYNIGQVIYSGSAVSTIIYDSEQQVYIGGTVVSTILDNSYQAIFSGGTAEFTIVNNSSYQTISNGGIVLSTTVNDTAYQQIYNGSAINTILNGGNQLIFSGGVADITSVNSGAIQELRKDGSAVNTIVNNDGIQQIFGGLVVSTTVDNGGRQLVYSGGMAQSTIINSNLAFQEVDISGSAVNTIVNDDGTQQIYGGAVLSTVINVGRQLVYSGGTAQDTNIYSGIQAISSGFAMNTVISGGYSELSNVGQIISYGSAISNVLTDAQQRVFVGGTVISNVINGDYGKQLIFSGGIAQSTTLDNNGGQYIYSGGVVETTIINSGIQEIDIGGSAISTTINSNGGQEIYFTGKAESTIINNNGIQQINSGGSAVNTVINDDGGQQNYGGTLISTTINDNGHQQIFSGGLAQDTTIYNGIQIISSGGSGNNTIISGGYATLSNVGQIVDNGGIATNVIINNAEQAVFFGGFASNTTVNAGGIQSVYTGGAINNTTINNGGVLIINNGATLDGVATLNLGGSATIYPQVGGTIDLAGNTNAGLTISGLEDGGEVTTVISGFNGANADSSDAIQLAGIYTSNVTNVAYEDADGNQSGDYVTLTLTNNSKITLNIIGAQDAGYSLGSAPDGSLTYEVCFLSGSMIRAAEGEIAVENIRIGDQVLTFDWQKNQEVVRSVRWVGSKRIAVNPNLMDDEAGYPVRILKNAISDGVPYKDLLITSEHSLFFNNTFTPVRMLVNGYSIYYDYSITNYTYYHIETESHSVIWADGMLTETYLDTGNRAQFRQHGDYAVLTPSIIQQNWKQDAVAPLMVDRNVVEPLYNQLLQRAVSMELPMMQSEKQFTDDPGLHLLMQDGSVIQPVSNYYKGQYTFLLPDEDIGSVYLVSRASRFSDIIGPFVDNRHYLGVLVGKINIIAFDQSKSIKMHIITDHLNQVDLPGWHGIEVTPHRWTNGKALLNIPKDNLKKRRLTIHVCSDRSYVINDRTQDQFIAI